MASLMGSVARRLMVVASSGQIVLSGIFLLEDQCGGLTALVLASLHAYPIYLLMSLVAAAELAMTVGMVWGRLRRAFFYLALVLYVVMAYHFGWYVSLFFVKTKGHFSCVGVLLKAAFGFVLFTPMWVNILACVCFLAVFLRVNKLAHIFMEASKNK